LASDSNDPDDNDSDYSGPEDPNGFGDAELVGEGPMTDGRLIELPIEDELKDSYLTYAMSVIVSRALPDVRDGLKPSQRRILVAMNDLNLGPGAARVKCAKISGDTSGNYHPHGESVIYPTLVRMAQEWNMRYPLIDKQGNFGSIAGLPAAAMRYTEARLSQISAQMLDDLKLDTVDYIPTYDERNTEPTVLPSRFPNLLVNGSSGIAVGMATSIPPHNLVEVCDALIRLIENPYTSLLEVMEIIKGPDFPTGGIICGRGGIRRGYMTGRSTITVRARARIEEVGKRSRIVVSEIPYQQYRDRVVERIAALVTEGRIVGISELRDESDLKEPVRLVINLKRDADPEVVLNQLYQFSPLQESFSIILLALVDGKPRLMTIKAILEEFLRHRVTVIRRRSQHLLAGARRRKHTVEGLLLALANIDEIIRIIRASRTQAEAKAGLMGVACPAAMMERALGDEGFQRFQEERGASDSYTLTAVQADAILRMTLGQLVNLEQEKLSEEHRELLAAIGEHLRILEDDANVYALIREDLETLKKRYSDGRRTEISGEELGDFDMEDLITEETMVVTISHQGYIKRTPASVYRAQRRGGKGLKGAKTEEEDPIQHVFVASTHAYLLFFTNRGRVYWQKVYELPQLGRDSRGRAVVNLLNLDEGEVIADCRPVRDFDLPGHFLMMATADGLVKKTPLDAYSRPKKDGIIAIKLREGDELVDVAIVKPGDEVVLSTANGMAIRFRESDARPMGRNTSGVKGISLTQGDRLVGMVVADPEAMLLTACRNGYGKRTNFGPNSTETIEEPVGLPGEGEEQVVDTSLPAVASEPAAEPVDSVDGAEEDESTSSTRYRTQRRGGKGLRDIKATTRNGPVIGICRVDEDDEVLVMTERGKIQRIRVAEIRLVGRNTQGVRIMSLDESDALTAIVRVPKEDAVDGEVAVEETDGAALLDSDREAASFPSPDRAAEDDMDRDIDDEGAGSDEGSEDEV
jgi:DNA gyrase subunit A